jgi:filamentous hemagglutinin family protein
MLALQWALLLTLLLVLNAPDTMYAQVVTNITPTTTAPLDLGTEVDTVGSTTEITGGTRPGSGTNLFHSFDFFTLGTNDVAHFMNGMMLPTTNIIARVIGGEASKSVIDGTLRTNNPLNVADPMNFGAANLWLVNPSGLLLGPNARVEVGGSVSMSTANYLRFDGTSALFDMLSSPASLGPLSVALSMLQVPQGQALSCSPVVPHVLTVKVIVCQA